MHKGCRANWNTNAKMMSCNSDFHALINHRLVRETPSYNFSPFVFVN